MTDEERDVALAVAMLLGEDEAETARALGLTPTPGDRDDRAARAARALARLHAALDRGCLG